MHISECSNIFIPYTKGPCPTLWKAMGTFWRKRALESTRNSPTKINPLWTAKHHEWELRTPGSNLTSVKTLYSIVKIEIDSLLASFFLAPAASWLKSSHLQNCTMVLASNSNRSGFTFRVLSNQTDRDHSMEAHSESITLPPPHPEMTVALTFLTYARSLIISDHQRGTNNSAHSSLLNHPLLLNAHKQKSD